jgi:hypothetical protein
VSAHTPGPWAVTHRRVVERSVRVAEHFAIAPQSGPTFAFLPEGRADIQEANARHIAAAPELLAALHSLLISCTEARWPLTSDQMMPLSQARAAIAKAEGQ